MFLNALIMSNQQFSGYLLAILFLLVSPAIAMNLYSIAPQDPLLSLRSILIAILVFCLPVVFFRQNLRWYFYLLLPLIALTPVFLFSIIMFGLPPGFGFIAFVLQTNPRETGEAIGPFIYYFIPVELLYIICYCFAVSKLPEIKLSTRTASCISGGCCLILLSITYYVNGLAYKNVHQLRKSDFLLGHDYPLALLHGVNEARIFLKKNNLKQAENFTFRAVKNDTLRQREIYVVIIGESARYDRWQINGYDRQTSPRLAARTNLITYSDVVAGAHYTWVSVPQIITRATPNNYDLQYREKSILVAFQEAGFKTVWLSNQSDQDIFWSGSIILHAKTAEVHKFSPTYSPNMEFQNIYDGRLLPLLDSVLRADEKNLFVVMHTMGNHWEYSKRYPPEFDIFKPSGWTQAINPPGVKNREAILNSYDNSILYADHIIDSVINLVDRSGGISTVTYISDHGEDLFDVRNDEIDFHFRPSAATLQIPLFIWTSEGYKKIFPSKRSHLEKNMAKKIGTENIFYTQLDLANIGIDAFDSTKSFAHPGFVPSQQMYYGDERQGRLFSELPQPLK